MKVCSKCNQEKELDDFAKNKTSKNGYRRECKKCHSKNVSIINKTSIKIFNNEALLYIINRQIYNYSKVQNGFIGTF